MRNTNPNIHLKVDLQGDPQAILSFLETVVYYIERDLDKSEFLQIDSLDDPPNIKGSAEIILPEERTTPRTFIWEIIETLFEIEADNVEDEESIDAEKLMEQAVPIFIQKVHEELGIELTPEQAKWYLHEAL